MVEPIFVINMVGYEISDCLWFAKAKRMRQTWRSDTFLGSTMCAINLHCTHDILLKTICVRPPCANVYHIKTMCDGQPLPHSFFYAPCVMHWIMQMIKLLISCAMATLSQTIEREKLRVMYLWTETFSLERLCEMYIRTETFSGDWLCGMYLRPETILPV